MKKLREVLYTHIIEVISFFVLLLVFFVSLNLAPSFSYVILVAIVVYVLTLVALTLLKKKSKRFESPSVASMPLLRSLLSKLDMPVALIDEDNRFRWFNKEFSNLTEAKNIRLGTIKADSFGGLLNFATLENAYKEQKRFVDINSDDVEYRINLTLLEYDQKKHFATIWQDREEYNSLLQVLQDKNVLVAHIVVDNVSEIGQSFSERNKISSVKISTVLHDWAKSINGLLTEYDRDKYVLQFEHHYLKDMEESRFDILDKVVLATAEDSVLPLTISIGISFASGSLTEKHISAQSALQSALQRGGAQVVVKTPDGDVTYGGRNKAVQKQTRIRSRVCKDLLLFHIPRSSNVLVMGHARPDFDSIASAIGIAKLVSHLGVRVNIIADRNEKNIKQIFDLLEDINEYDSIFVDSIYGQELLTPETLVVITDASNPEMFEAPFIYENARRVIVIDHHGIKDKLGPQVLQPENIDPTASSASELVCEILELALPPNTLRVEEAQILMAGILLDTQNFTRDTGTRTFSACMYLRSEGAEAGKAQQLFKSSLDEFQKTNLIVNDFSVYRDRFAISIFDSDSDPINKIAAAKAAERLINIENISASMVLYLLDNGYNLSARSDGTINVMNIAKLLGGGGHFQSAGALIKTKQGQEFVSIVYNREDAVKLLKEAIDEYLEDHK